MNNDFSKGSVEKSILIQAVPLTIAQLIQLLYNIVDRIYIGHLPGSDGLALTGIGLCFPLITIVAAFTNLFGMGGAPLCSIARGAGDQAHAEDILGVSAWLLFVSSILITIFCYALRQPILYLFGASDNTYPYADAYLSIYLLGTMFTMLGTGLNYFINSQGFPQIGMCTTLLGALLNILLDPLFIFVFHMGVRGAALATVISQAVSAVWVLRFLISDRAIIRLKRSCLHYQGALTREITTLGLSGFIMQATNCLVQVACNVSLQMHGGDLYVGIITIINSIREIVSLPATGITSASQPILGFNYGAKAYSRVRRGIVFTTLISVAYAALAWIVILLIPEQLIRIFNTNPETVQQGAVATRVYFAGFFFMVFQFCGQSFFVGLGDSRHAIFFSILRKAIIVAPLTFILPEVAGLGVMGVFLAEPISNVIGGLSSYITMLFTVWRKLSPPDKAEMQKAEHRPL